MNKQDNSIVEFEWDLGNQDKNWDKHKISREEAESAFFDPEKLEYPDPAHSTTEIRKIIVGLSKTGDVLFIVYTKRKEKIRIISARLINKKKEGRLYEKTTDSPKV